MLMVSHCLNQQAPSNGPSFYGREFNSVHCFYFFGGNKKPSNLEDFMADFLNEYNDLQVNGLMFQGIYL